MPELVDVSSRIEHVDFNDKNKICLNEKSPDLDIEAFRENRVCYDTNECNVIIAEPAIKYNAGNAMSKKIPYTFDTPVPKFFRENGWFKNPNMCVFVHWAFSRCSYEKHSVYHIQKYIELEPFEFIFGRRVCSEETGLTEREIRTCIEQLSDQQKSTMLLVTLEKTPSKTTNKYSVYKWVGSLFSQICDQQKDQQTTSRRPADDHNQEDKKIRYKENHHPDPSSEKVMIDDSLQKEKIHICLNVYLDQIELDECIKLKGSLENVKDCIEKIQKNPKRKATIVHWVDTLKTWKFPNVIADKTIENENIAKKFIEEYEENVGWEFRIHHDRVKDVRGILFQGLGATSQPEFIIFTDFEFKEKINKSIKDKKLKKKGK